MAQLLKLKETNPKTVKSCKTGLEIHTSITLSYGFEYATGDFIVTMDEDLQHNPIDIELIKSKRKDFDLVYGK